MKTWLITGCSTGLGRSLAKAALQKGDNVVVTARDTKKLEEFEKDFPQTALTVRLDVTDLCSVAEAVKAAKERFGGIDVLVNNAGISHIGLLMDMGDDDWRKVIDTNLSSVFYCCRKAIPPMISRQSGKIINISSMWGTSGASCEVAYSASKAGVNGLTKALAKELAPSNIQVNAIACGVIDTKMNMQLSEEERKTLENEIPAGRYGTAEEIAQVAWDLAHAPGYLTGQVIGVDGGYL